MPPVDPSRMQPPLAPGVMRPGGTIRTGTRAGDPYAAGKFGLDEKRLVNENTKTGLSVKGEAREDQFQTPRMRKANAEATKAEIEAIAAKEEARKAKEIRDAFASPVDKIMTVVRKAGEAHTMINSGRGTATNPLGRQVGQYLPNMFGNSAQDLAGLVDTLKANTSIENLQQMRLQSPTGAAVGNPSNKDLEMLGKTISSMNMGQSNNRLKKDFHELIINAKKILYKMPGGREAYRQWWMELRAGKKASEDNPEARQYLKQYGAE